MAEEKKKYWLKLDKDFLTKPQMLVVKGMPNGKEYIIFYLSLMLQSIETVGHLRFSRLIPYDDSMLAEITGTNIDIARSATKIFCEMGLMQIFDDGTIFMTEVPKITGKECDSADRVRLYRERKKESLPLQCNNDVTKCNDNIYIEEELYKKNINNTKEKEKENIQEKKEKDSYEVPTLDKKQEINKDIEQVISYLNDKSHSKFSAKTAETKKLLSGRFSDGYTAEDMQHVIDLKCEQWLTDVKMRQYIRPSTLFLPSKFESYLNEYNRTHTDEQQECKSEVKNNTNSPHIAIPEDCR